MTFIVAHQALFQRLRIAQRPQNYLPFRHFSVLHRPVRAMTEMLYMKDVESNYVKEFDARVIERGFDYVVLDRTAFYPLGGGQPSDIG